MSNKKKNSQDLHFNWLEAQNMLDIFNNTPYKKRIERMNLLQKLLGKCPETVNILNPFYCDFGSNISIGDHSFINFNCTVLDYDKVIIGNHVTIATGVQIITSYHPIRSVERKMGQVLSKPVIIGDNVWIGAGVIICPGVKIGINTTIGAGSVVTKDLPPNVVAYGNPCKIAKYLSDDSC